MNTIAAQPLTSSSVWIPLRDVVLDGDLTLPENPQGIVLFAHGSGSSRHSPRNRAVAQVLQDAGVATLLMDLLTHNEETIDLETRQLRFDIDLLAQRLIAAVDWTGRQETTQALPIGLFGASTGAAAALVAAAERPDSVRAVVSRGGRPDLAGGALPRVYAPTLLIVGGHDTSVMPLNVQALEQLAADDSRLEIVPRATHLFEEPGALAQVAKLAARWFTRHLGPHEKRAE